MAYLLEFIHVKGQEESVYIHLDFNPSLPKTDRLGKEECLAAIETGIEDVCQLFNIAGVVEAAVQTNLVWISKSSAFNWDQILPSVLSLIGAGEELCGSGANLPSTAHRKPLRGNCFKQIPIGQALNKITGDDVKVLEEDGCTLACQRNPLPPPSPPT